MTDTNSKAQVTNAILQTAIYRMCVIEDSPNLNSGEKALIRGWITDALAALAAQEKPEPGVAVKALREIADYEPVKPSDNPLAWRFIQKARSALVAPSPDLPEGEVETSHLAGLASCCHCGRIVDTRETKDGGDRFGAQLSDKRWTCSFECWEAIVDPSTSPSPIDKGEVESAAHNYAPCREHQLEDALRNLMGCYDTPLSRRRFPPDDFMREALTIARDLLPTREGQP